ncbi:DNA repair protein RadA [soil metagenome]
MSKSSSVFVCQNCGESSPKWSGQCPNCGEWNTLVETLKEAKPSGKIAGRGAAVGKVFDQTSVVAYGDVKANDQPRLRISTGIGEFDRVLGEDNAGKGMVPGAVMLIGGEPGIGKSTLLTQMVIEMLNLEQKSLSKKVTETDGTGKKVQADLASIKPILYVAGEESPHQIALRIQRILDNEHILLKIETLNRMLHFLTSTDVDQIVAAIEHEQPRLVIVDSIQTLTTDDLIGSYGSVGQIRATTERITEMAKHHGVPTFLVGHVTKEGTIAGPKVLEHIVDAVLELSGERNGELRLLRAIKNRFGATDEVGVFRVNEYGLAEVTNPSEIFLEQSQKKMPGSAVTCVIEGTRPLLLEVQALVVESQLAMPRRVGRGIQLARAQVLAAVLQKHCKIPLGVADIFLNVAGGFTVSEPAVDLGLAMAMVSSYKNVPLPEKMLFIGEVGLLGEIRNVNYLDRRIKEAKRLGFTRVISRQTHATLLEVLKDVLKVG